jgi:hypothetical protein
MAPLGILAGLVVLGIFCHGMAGPRMWIGSLLAFLIATPFFCLIAWGRYSFLYGLGLGALGGAFAFAVALLVGLCARRLFWRAYLAQEEKNTRSAHFVLRSRVAGSVAIVLGLAALWATWHSEPFNAAAALGGVMFIALGAVYVVARRGGATWMQWLLEGRLAGTRESPAGPPPPPPELPSEPLIDQFGTTLGLEFREVLLPVAGKDATTADFYSVVAGELGTPLTPERLRSVSDTQVPDLCRALERYFERSGFTERLVREAITRTLEDWPSQDAASHADRPTPFRGTLA